MLMLYEALQDIVAGKTNTVELPDIRVKSMTEIGKLYVRADTWEGGGRPVYVNCNIFIRIIGHCVSFTYGELMAGAHLHLTKARWADDLYIHFQHELESTATEDQLIQGIEDTLAECVFHQRECDMRVWGHRFGDLMASIVAGGLIAILVSLGSSCGTWVAVTASAVADPKPVAGPTSASWGYPVGRQSHMEARSRPSAGHGVVCLKKSSFWTSFRKDVNQDFIWQLVVGSTSLIFLIFKYPVRTALGFGPFQKPQSWVCWMGIGGSTLSLLISLQIPIWAWANGGRWSLLHGSILVLMQAASVGLRAWCRWKEDTSSVLSFWIADVTVWLTSIGGSFFSMHLGESVEYPVTGWIWPIVWLLAVASTGAGVPRHLG